MKTELVSEIRAFNRFYTNVLGLLNKTILDSSYTLTEVRILLEIEKSKNCTANNLSEALEVDQGYMSRILKRFETEGLVSRENSSIDRRRVILSLTSKGKSILSILEEKANEQIHNLTRHLTVSEQTKLVDSMAYISDCLTPEANSLHIRTFEIQDTEYIIRSHRDLYREEYGFSSIFGDYVEDTVLKFSKEYDDTKENIWIAELKGEPVGVIAIVKVNESTAQLRWFLLDPQVRGKGLGHKLVQTALDFCRQRGYEQIFLWTVDILKAARHLYKSYGFELMETCDNTSWTDRLIHEERWDLLLK